MTTQPVLQKVLKGILNTEEEKYNHENMGKKKSYWMNR
jgi:hypothetical protein